MGNANARRVRRQDTYMTSSSRHDVTGIPAIDNESDGIGESSSSGYHSNYYNPYGEEPDALEIAIRDERLDDVRELMKTYRVDQRIAWDTTPVHVACENGSLPVLEYLVECHRGDVNVADNETGSTSPLIVASRFGHLDVVKYLLSKDANIDHRSNQESCHRWMFEDEAMNMTRDRGLGHLPAAVQREMWDPYRGNSALMQAAREHYPDVVSELLNKGADVNLHNAAGNTALHIACLSRTAEVHCSEFSLGVPSTLFIGGHPDIVSLLLRHGSRVDATNLSGETPLSRLLKVTHMGPLCMWDWNFTEREIIALTSRTLQIIKYLIAYGSDVTSGTLAAVWNIAAVQPTKKVHQELLATLAVLREAGYTTSCCEVESLIHEHAQYVRKFPCARHEITRMFSSPLSLKMAALVSIRRHLCLPYSQTISSLPLPRDLRSDILMRSHFK